MRIPRSLMALTVANSVLLAVLLAQQLRPVFAEDQPPILRGRGLQIVDSHGRVRASISVLPPEKPNETETVLLRLITEQGRPTVKISAAEATSGLSFAGPTGTRDTYVILKTAATVSSLQLRSENGHEQVLSP